MLSARIAKLHAAVDRQTGERVRVKPQSGGGYTASSDDQSRAAAEIIAYVARIPGAVRTAGNSANSGHNVQLRASADTIKYATSALPYEMREGDLVELLDVAGVPEFRVSRTAPFGTDRTVLFLVPVRQ